MKETDAADFGIATHSGSQCSDFYQGFFMRKTPPNHGKDWKRDDVKQLQKLADGNTPTGLIAHKMGRTEASVRNKASEEDISLKPTNQSPYNRLPK